jgi:hypothetical protein
VALLNVTLLAHFENLNVTMEDYNFGQVIPWYKLKIISNFLKSQKNNFFDFLKLQKNFKPI